MITAAKPRWALQRRGGVLTLRNSGVITLHSQMEGRKALYDAVTVARPGAVLVDLRGAVMLLSRDDWLTMANPAYWEDTAARLPVAYVTTSVISDQAAAYCAEMMGHGLLRMVFSRHRPAFDWCAWHARSGAGMETVQ